MLGGAEGVRAKSGGGDGVCGNVCLAVGGRKTWGGRRGEMWRIFGCTR